MNRYIKYFFLTLFLLATSTGNALPPDSYASNSVLSQGQWKKIEIGETGVYKITYDELKKWGFDNPDNVGVYGYGGNILPESFLEPYIDDLPEVAVWKEKSNDGTFKSGNYLLFYGKGLVKWDYNASSDVFEHTNNCYATKAYYFLHQKNEKSKEISTGETNTPAGHVAVTTFDDYYLHEKDEVSLKSSGRELFGERFSSSGSQIFTVATKGIDPAPPGKVHLSFVAKTLQDKSTVQFSINDVQVINAPVPKTSSSATVAFKVESSAQWNTKQEETNKITIRYSGSPNDKNVHLNFFRLQYKRKLQPYEGFTLFRNTSAIYQDARFSISEASSDILVWDISNAETPVRIATKDDGASQYYFDTQANGTLREFVLIDRKKSFLSVINTQDVVNQNLHGADFCDMVIIAPSAFILYAKQLAYEHQVRDNLTTIVVTPEEIYNEFSSGTPDATAYRRFLKMFYDRATSPQDHHANYGKAPKYLLLYGDGAYDNRFITDLWKRIPKENFLLTFQSKESILDGSYTSDDYFGFLDDHEGVTLSSDILDIGIGRFPVRTEAQAKAALDKIVIYMDNKTLGTWKNNLVWVADDGSNSDSFRDEFMETSETVTKKLEQENPEFIHNKVYFDAFKKKTVAGKGSYPDARDRLYNKHFKEGMLLFNYMGHGGPISLADEGIVTMADITSLNYPQWPLWITSACDFCPFDDINTSAGENVFLNPKGAGIALYTTTRLVQGTPSLTLNQKMVAHIFDKANGKRLALGDIMKNAKQDMGTGSNKLNFVLIGDPALKLAYPEYRIQIDSINGTSVEEIGIFQIKALETIRMSGKIMAPDRVFDPTFTGELHLKVFDCQDTITCFNNNKKEKTFKYVDYPNVLFSSKDSVINGQFEFTFLVPKDISYSNKPGKMNFYASSNAGDEIIEAQGYFLDYMVGGSANFAPSAQGPEIIQLYLNDPSFTSGATVNETPLLVAHVYDENGINISGNGIGHDIIVKIDNRPDLRYTANDYFQFFSGSYQEGCLSFSIPELSAGRHTLELTIWNLQNNVTIHEIEFVVKPGMTPELIELIIMPNPVKENVVFSLNHDRPETHLDIGIYVYDLTGQIVWQYHEEGESQALRDYTIQWDLVAGNGSRLKSGIYLVKATLSTKGSKTSSKAKKMIVLAQ